MTEYNLFKLTSKKVDIRAWWTLICLSQLDALHSVAELRLGEGGHMTHINLYQNKIFLVFYRTKLLKI